MEEEGGEISYSPEFASEIEGPSPTPSPTRSRRRRRSASPGSGPKSQGQQNQQQQSPIEEAQDLTKKRRKTSQQSKGSVSDEPGDGTQQEKEVTREEYEDVTSQPRRKRLLSRSDSPSSSSSPTSLRRKSSKEAWMADPETLALAKQLFVVPASDDMYSVKTLSSLEQVVPMIQQSPVFLVFTSNACHICEGYEPQLRFLARMLGSSVVEPWQHIRIVIFKIDNKPGKLVQEIATKGNHPSSAGFASVIKLISNHGVPQSVLLQPDAPPRVYPPARSRTAFVVLDWIVRNLSTPIPTLQPQFIDFSSAKKVTNTTQFVVFYNGRWGIVPAFARCLTPDMILLEMADVQQYILWTLLTQVPWEIIQRYVAFIDVQYAAFMSAVTILNHNIMLPETQRPIPFTGWLAIDMLHRDVLPFLATKGGSMAGNKKSIRGDISLQ